MKRWLARGVLLLGLVAVSSPGVAFAQDEDEDESEYEDDTEAAEIEDTDPSAVTIFRTKLEPHGTWVEHPVYGTIWVPSAKVVGPDFAPYVTNGRWELGEDGEWLWVSGYDWGYVPFHYGRWVWVSGVGWSWIPGRVYAPAWVVWRVGSNGYIGWAPMPPAYYWSNGYAVAFWAVPFAPFVFVHTHHAFHHHVHTYVVRDQHEVHVAATGTHGYHSATPRPAHKAASPTLADAGISPKDAPKTRSKHDPRAIQFMKDAKPTKGFSPKSSAARTKDSQRDNPRISQPSGGSSKARSAERGSGRASRGDAAVKSPGKARRVSPVVGQRSAAARSSAFGPNRATYTGGSRRNAPRTTAPDTSAPKTSAPRTSAPRTSSPRTSVPRTSAPTNSPPRSSAPTTQPAVKKPAPAPPAVRRPAPSTRSPRRQ